MTDLSERLTNRVQLSSDALKAHVDAMEQAFGADVDFGQAVQFHDATPAGPSRYSPPKVTYSARSAIAGKPDFAPISTNLVERQNLTMRMSMRRFTRLTNAFTKKIENLRAAVNLHFAHYNMVRVHSAIRCRPAMEGGVNRHVWSLSELVALTSS